MPSSGWHRTSRTALFPSTITVCMWGEFCKPQSRFCVLSDKYHRAHEHGPFSGYAHGGWSLSVLYSIVRRGPYHNKLDRDRYAKPFELGTDIKRAREINWPSAEEYFWECTHPVQWTLSHYMDIRGYSSFYGDIPAYKNPCRSGKERWIISMLRVPWVEFDSGEISDAKGSPSS